MSELCRFRGIVITMYWNDHNPPHFHVRHGSDRARVGLGDLRLLRGSRLSPSTYRSVMEWASEHSEELEQAWAWCRQRLPPGRIPPLE